MTYKLLFVPSAMKEWKKLDRPLAEQIKQKLLERLTSPHVKKDGLLGSKDLYKIKLKSSGYRLVYQVDDKEKQLLVLAVGKRNRSQVYNKAKQRL